ncbi:MAG: glycosyltransferase family 39 protein [Acidobacteriota bacterium]|jgi:4-amino-4-deoxy-L-arabinose transferase-like glycosyltransferase|nr:glycosyltransferase family 39 protein [Acidobacteriota bacterium]NLT32235.1 glycosyltransferase family 39 protein [Acidobacteriota bacterium]
MEHSLRTPSWIDAPLAHVLLLTLLALPYFVNLGVSSLWDANEAFYAETPREMMVTGDYLAPRFNFEPRVQKPPLTYWVVLLSYRVFGVGEFAVRFPGALAALGILLFCYGAARSAFGPRAGLAAAAIAATTARIFILARRLPIDILLLFFLTGALFFILRALRRDGMGPWIPVYLFLGLAFMTKGPVALVIPAAALGGWWILARRRPWARIYPLLGSVIIAAVVLPWYLAVWQAHGWDYIAPFFLSDNLGRFATETLGPSRSVFYYIPVFLSNFFPWSLLLAAALVSWRRLHREAPAGSSPAWLLLCWACVVFLLFSLSKNKQEYYIAPMYPACAILIAGALVRKPRLRPGATWAYGAAAVLMLGLSLALPSVFTAFMPALPPLLRYGPTVLFAAGALAVGVCTVRRRRGLRFVALALSLWSVYLLGAAAYIPALEALRPVKGFCRTIARQWRPDLGDSAGFYRASLPSMVFYLQRPIFQETDPEGMLGRFRSPGRVFCILSRADYEYFLGRGADLHIIDQGPLFSLRFGSLLQKGKFPGRELILVSNRSWSTIASLEGDVRI